MPTNRFSTRSSRPTPCLPPISLSRVSKAAGDSASPSTATGSPRAKSISIYCRVSGRISGAALAVHTYSSAYRNRRLAALVASDGDLVHVGVFEQPRARGQVPFAPRRDDLDVGRERVIAEFETDLVVALAGGAVGHRVGADLAGNLDLALGDQGAGDRGAEQVLAFVESVGAEHRKDEIADEFLTQH